MTRRIILVDFYWTRDKDPRVPLGQASLLAALRTWTNADVRPVTVAVNATKQTAVQIAEQILEHTNKGLASASVDIAIGAYVWAEELIQRLLPTLRDNGFQGRIILGGPQISYMDSGLEQIYPAANVFVRGYGEKALAELAIKSGSPQIAGVHYAGEVDRREQADVDLQKLPSPWLEGLIPLDEQQFIRWETQRGCQYRCTFCQHREAGARLTRRKLDDDRIFDEIDLFCESGVREIAVLDPIFNTSTLAPAVLERFVKHDFRGRLSLQCRAETVDERFLDAAEQLDICLEFGLQTIHNNEQKAIHRNNIMERVDNTFDEVRRRGIDFEVSLIFGLPEQTLLSFIESVDWCLQRCVPVIKAFPLMLLRGTPLERERERWGLLEDGSAMPKVIASNSFSRSEWAQMAQISEALSKTEGRHPVHIDDLLRIAQNEVPDLARWQPKID